MYIKWLGGKSAIYPLKYQNIRDIEILPGNSGNVTPVSRGFAFVKKEIGTTGREDFNFLASFSTRYPTWTSASVCLSSSSFLSRSVFFSCYGFWNGSRLAGWLARAEGRSERARRGAWASSWSSPSKSGTNRDRPLLLHSTVQSAAKPRRLSTMAWGFVNLDT